MVFLLHACLDTLLAVVNRGGVYNRFTQYFRTQTQTRRVQQILVPLASFIFGREISLCMISFPNLYPITNVNIVWGLK